MPTKPSTNDYTYVFVGWDKVVSQTLTESITYYAIYDVVGRTYDVVFYDGNGSVLEVQKITYGQSAMTPFDVPYKNSDAIYEYVFTAWQQDYTNITDNLSVYPTFEPKLRTFDVVFVNYDGQETIVKVEYGKSAVGKVVTPYQPGYRFVNWDKDISYITSELTVRAIYTPNDYYIRFMSDEADSGMMDPIIASYDSNVFIPDNQYERRGYFFAGWKKDAESDNVDYLNGESFVLEEEGVDLYAEWIPIVYSIDYILDGGQAMNPNQYT